MGAEKRSGQRIFRKLCDEVKRGRISGNAGIKKRAGKAYRFGCPFFGCLKSRSFLLVELTDRFIQGTVFYGREGKIFCLFQDLMLPLGIGNGDQTVFMTDGQAFQAFFQKNGKRCFLTMPV